MDTAALKQEATQIERNPVGLPTETAKDVGNLLDRAVATYSTLFHQYLKRHWLVEGPEHRDLHIFYEKLYQETQEDMDAIAERMTTLGCVPTCGLTEQASISLIQSEKEGSFAIRQMMERDLECEQAVIEFLRDSITRTNKLSDYATETLLKQTIMRAEERAHEFDHYLAKDSLASDPQDVAAL